MKCQCGGEYKYAGTAIKDDHTVRFYKCSKCEEVRETHHYRYTPLTCPKHQFQFDRWLFRDDPWHYDLGWQMVCDRCGKTEFVPFDVRSAGKRGSVEVEDPRVMKALELNEHTARFHLGKDLAKEFYK